MSTGLRLLGDENLDARILRGLSRRVPAVTLRTVQELGLSGASDRVILERAAAEGWVVLTHDAATMTKSAVERLASNLPMPGLIVIRRAPIGVAISDLELVVETSGPQDLDRRIIYIPL